MGGDGFIGFPPGMTPPSSDTDSGTKPVVRPARPEIVFRPVVPGAPVPGTSVAAPPPGSGPAPAPVWRLRIPGVAEPVVVADAVVLGRNPVAPPAVPSAVPAPVQDPAKSVSKTHAVVVLRDDVLIVRDLDSTNGVWVVVPGAEPLAVEPGAEARVPAGADLELGEFVIRVERS